MVTSQGQVTITPIPIHVYTIKPRSVTKFFWYNSIYKKYILGFGSFRIMIVTGPRD